MWRQTSRFYEFTNLRLYEITLFQPRILSNLAEEFYIFLISKII